MRPGGLGATTVGQVIGVGRDRGAALVVIIAGLALAALAVWLRRKLGGSLDARHDEVAPAGRDDVGPETAELVGATAG